MSDKAFKGGPDMSRRSFIKGGAARAASPLMRGMTEAEEAAHQLGVMHYSHGLAESSIGESLARHYHEDVGKALGHAIKGYRRAAELAKKFGYEH